MTTRIFRILCALAPAFFVYTSLMAHNGSVLHAYPLGNIKIDGNFSEWPGDAAKYMIRTHMSDAKPLNEKDFSGFFQVGYRMDTRSLYIAFTIHDDDFIEDTTENVMFNTQDCLELCIDARHLRTGSGVASFMYSKKLRNINRAFYDPFTSVAGWHIMEVAMTQKEGTRYYEWRIKLDNELVVGKSIGFDFMVFDKDSDQSFSFTSWGGGESKYINPHSLGDILILPREQKLASLTGLVRWDQPVNEQLPNRVRIISKENTRLWVDAGIDSLGNYSVQLPPGKYQVLLPDTYFPRGKKIFATGEISKDIMMRAGEATIATDLVISSTPAPDLVPSKGILLDFTPASTAKVDGFIETYRKYYNIPGVSLALIKDGRVVYHKTYGVKNQMTGDKVNESTLFEAASITKPVFAFAVQRLAERGIIDLDRPLYLYLPYRDIEYDERYKLITARHVLTHRTGFPNWRSMNPGGKLDIRFTPGTQYNYSGEGFEYLKLVIEKITGKKVEQVLQEEVIDPIGLYHTFFSKNDSLQQLVANGHYNGLPTPAELPESPGMAYSMHTEALVFSKFALYLLEQKGLKSATYDTMFQKHSEFNFDSDDERPKYPSYMGMSLEIRETPFGKSFGHGGNNGDFKCKFEMYRGTGMGYVLFTNSNTSDALLDAIRLFLVEGKN